jgi:hypothetical protein
MELGPGLSLWICNDEQSGLLMRIATESVSLCMQMKKLTPFNELQSAIRAVQRAAIG